ncbi:unnamed protein product [Caenorhabditis auriculariae]|uniref:Uncharacterized protein n=1 Tax=Caenorhabditis auriculariae TaxID=2777116 RepID=A0A8S1H3P5_9PELO|nr:unnamed protein product [Caenorhabditis auriculariae]
MAECATPETMQIMTSFATNLPYAVHVIVCLATVVLSIIAVRMLLYRSIFHDSTRILFFVSLFYANLHELMQIYNEVTAFYRSMIYADAPCKILVTQESCRLENNLIVSSIAGMVFVECALTMDRIIATYSLKKSVTMSSSSGFVLALAAIIGSILVPFITFYGDPYTGYVQNCMLMPAQSKNRANTLLFCYTIINIVNIALNSVIIYINKRQDRGTRFKLKLRYQARETLISTLAVCTITTAQFIALAIYSGGILLMRTNQDHFTLFAYFAIIPWVYAVPYAAISLPTLIIVCVSITGKDRRRAIEVVQNTKETQEGRMKSLNEMWNNSY